MGVDYLFVKYCRIGYYIFTINKLGAIIPALLATLLYPQAGWSMNPVTDGVVWSRPYGMAGDRGMAIAIGDDGNVYIAGKVVTSPAQVFATKINPTTNYQVGQYFIGTGILTVDKYPMDILAVGKDIYICGAWDTGTGFISKFRVDGTSIDWTRIVSGLSNAAPFNGIVKMTRDPVDGSVWAVGSNDSSLPGKAVLLHVTPDGVVTRESITHGGQNTYAYGIGTDGEQIYIGGAAVSGGNVYPWIYSRKRETSGAVFSRIYTEFGPTTMCWSLAVSVERLFASVANNSGGIVYAVSLDKSGNKLYQVTHMYSYTVGTPPTIELHPTQQIPLFFGGGAQLVQAYDKNLKMMWGVAPFDTWVENIYGLAFEPGLYGNMYATGAIGTPSYIKMATVKFGETNGMPADILIAPNIIELQGVVRQAGISIKTSAAAMVTVDIMDSAGNFVRRLSGVANKEGYVNMPWDIRDKNGNFVAPGTYFAKTIAEGGMMKPLLVVKKRKK